MREVQLRKRRKEEGNARKRGRIKERDEKIS